MSSTINKIVVVVLVILALVAVLVMTVIVVIVPFVLVLVSLFTRIAWTQLAVLENPQQGTVVTVHNKSSSRSGSRKILDGKFCQIFV